MKTRKVRIWPYLRFYFPVVSLSPPSHLPYMLLISTQVNAAVFGVFLTLEATEILLFIGLFTTKTPILPPHTAGWVRAGGYVGVLTALVAWYASAAGVMNGHKGRQIVPVGAPLIKL